MLLRAHMDGHLSTNLNQPIPFCAIDGTPIQPQPKQACALSGWYSIHTIIQKNAEELYQLRGVLVAIAALIPFVVKDVLIPIFRWILANFEI